MINNMTIDFPFVLTMLVIISGIIALIDILFFAKKRKISGKKQPIIFEYARSFFPILLLVWGIRSFLVQPYRVPTGSLEPTVLPGDFIVVNQFSYGLRLPVLNKKLVSIGEPKTGDIVLFRWPPNPSTIYVKRVIGVPGDHVIYKNKVLTINGKVMSQESLGSAFDFEPGDPPIPSQLKEENLNGIKHKILLSNQDRKAPVYDIVVPKNMYFMVGDNRDDSGDSRMWGFVPEANLVGKAFGIWMSWDSDKSTVRWQRIGTPIH